MDATLIASVGEKEKRDAASRIMTITIIFAGLLLTKYAAMTEFSTAGHNFYNLALFIAEYFFESNIGQDACQIDITEQHRFT